MKDLEQYFLSVCRLADYDVVVTTYSLVSKEIPVQKEEAHNPSKDPDCEVNTIFKTKSKILSAAFISKCRAMK